MTADSLIAKLTAIKMEKSYDSAIERVYDGAVDRCIEIIQAHQADHPHAQAMNISPEHVQKVERIKRDEQQDVGRVAEALLAFEEKNRDLELLGLEGDMAKAAIAVMSLRSVDLSDEKGQEETERPAKEFGVGVPSAAPDSLVDELRICLHQAIIQCEVHNSEYQHVTPEKLITHWKEVHNRASIAIVAIPKRGALPAGVQEIDRPNIDKAKELLRELQNSYRNDDTAGIDVMYSCATEALAALSGGQP